MNLKETGSRIFFSIPHFSELFNMRRNQRYALHKETAVKVKDTRDTRIDGRLIDISFDGMRLLTSDKRIEGLKAISLSVDDFRVELPCQKIWQSDTCYRVEFGSMDRQEFADLKYFIEHYIIKAPDNLLELLM